MATIKNGKTTKKKEAVDTVSQNDLSLIFTLEKEIKEKEKMLKEYKDSIIVKIRNGFAIELGELDPEIKEGQHNIAWKERAKELFAAIPVAMKRTMGLLSEFKDQEDKWAETDRTPNGVFRLSINRRIVQSEDPTVK